MYKNNIKKMHDYMDTVFVPVFEMNRLFSGNL